MKPSENPAWLAVEGWCTPEEGDALYEAARALPDDTTVIDIGTYKGRSAIALAMGGAYVVTIDNDRNRNRSEALLHNLNACDVSLTSFVVDNHIVADGWQMPISLLYIDGWHDSENVRADYAAWAPHVVPNGAIWFHDAYGAGWPDVHALIDELVANEALVLDGYVGTIAKCRKVAP